MSFLRRLGIYLIGLSMGIVILSFFFKGKEVSFCYFPNCRTLKDIRSKSVIVSKNLFFGMAMLILAKVTQKAYLVELIEL